MDVHLTREGVNRPRFAHADAPSLAESPQERNGLVREAGVNQAAWINSMRHAAHVDEEVPVGVDCLEVHAAVRFAVRHTQVPVYDEHRD
jgi:hypothetical protein